MIFYEVYYNSCAKYHNLVNTQNLFERPFIKGKELKLFTKQIYLREIYKKF